jgi:fused signal recognition particle receptor
VSDTSPKSRGLLGLFRRSEAPPPAASAETAAPVPEPTAASETPTEPPKKQGWFQRLKAGLTKTSARLSEDIAGIFTKRKLDADTLQELEDLLIRADLGVETAMRITEALAKGRYDKEIAPAEVRAVLAAEVERTLAPVAKPLRLDGAHRPHVILVVGVNGTGKTTTIGKLAHKLIGEGKKVTLAAGDTFRAAAVDQLKIWGERSGAEVVARAVGADSAGLAYDVLKRARENGSDVLLIDTAGRLQNKQALMDELEKVIRVLGKIDPTAPHQVLLVLDATTGQNALNQVEIFKEKAGVTGLVMTKLDGTARGGILVAISAKFGLPVHAIGVGEGVEDLAGFDADEFARAITLS